MSQRRPTLPLSMMPGGDEAAVLGGILLRNSLLGELPRLQVQHFFDPRHKVVFASMRALERAELPIDVVLLERQIGNSGKLEAIGGVAFLGELALQVPAAFNVLLYAENVITASIQRDAALGLESALSTIRNGALPAFEALEEAISALQRIREEAPVADRQLPNKWVTPLEDLLLGEEPSEDDSNEWIIRDLIPRMEPWLFAGAGKVGKTTTSIDMGLSLALGQDWLGFDNCLQRPARVTILCGEDSELRLRKKLWELCRTRALRPDDPRIRENLRITTKRLRMPSADVSRLALELRNDGADLCIIDNVSRVIVGDPNKTSDATDFIHAWYDLGDESRSTIGFLHHTKKSQEGRRGAETDPFDDIRGSGEFVNGARHILLAKAIRTDDGSKLKKTEYRMRGNIDLRREDFALGYERVRDPEGKWYSEMSYLGTLDELRAQLKAEKTRSLAARRADELLTRRAVAIQIATSSGNVTAPQLADALGLTPRAVAEVLTQLVDDGVFVRAGKRGYGLASAQPNLPISTASNGNALHTESSR